MRYATGQWDCEVLGNHRVVLRVASPADAVCAGIEWRRRDRTPQNIDTVVICARTQKRVDNVARIKISRLLCDLVFQAEVAGEYHVYYLPYRNVANTDFMRKYFVNIRYEPPANTVDAAWLARHELADPRNAPRALEALPQAEIVEMQSIDDFHRFDPMEIIAADKEVESLLAGHPGQAYLVFPEDRLHPIRMFNDLPKRWIDSGLSDVFTGDACRGEYYAFQLGVYAAKMDLEDIRLSFTDARSESGAAIPADSFHCMNLVGTDWLGRGISKRVDVATGRVQPLWCCLQVPADAEGGLYSASVIVSPANAPSTEVSIRLTVTDELRNDAGDDELWRHSRLRWLDSTIALDDEVFEPYTPVEVQGRIVHVLGREITFGELGLPESIRTTFPPTVDGVDAEPTEILAAPMWLSVQTTDGLLNWQTGQPQVVARSSGAVTWQTQSRTGRWMLTTTAKMECDGYVDFELTLTAGQAGELRDVALEIPMRPEAATYMMGLGRIGGYRPSEWDWHWNVEHANNQFWIGAVNAGLNCKLKHVEPDWSLTDLHSTGLYRDWANGGKGGCRITQTSNDEIVLIRAYTGPRPVHAGEQLHFNFGLLITPVKMLDRNHWHWRYIHESSGKISPPVECAAKGAKVVNVHHATPINPHINYPFLMPKEMKAYADAAHDAGMKFKVYYTVRELTNFTTELWALRSLGDEVFMDGPGIADPATLATLGKYHDHTGDSWLCEHLVSGYRAAWQQPLEAGRRDAAIETVGLSRWHNYYIEGLRWLLQNVGIDGLYLDGIGYDRQIMKRLRKVMQRTRPGCLIDFHSGNGFDAAFGGAGPACQYAEHLPFIDSLWFGEGFDYQNTPPDYWLVEVSGIPFGLFGEMLQDGGNPWRGMLYGMTSRLGWVGMGDPAPLWELWDQFGIDQADMIGYWAADCPVRTDHPGVPATVYRRDGLSLVSIASWAPCPVECRLIVDWEALGIDPESARIVAPAIRSFQPAASFSPADPIPVDPARGWLLYIKGP